MEPDGRDGPVESIERALRQLRRDQDSRRMSYTTEAEVLGGEDEAAGARYRYLDALVGYLEGRPIGDVADEIEVDRPRASRLTAELVQDLLIERRPDPVDAHLIRVHLSSQGRALVGHMHAHRRRSIDVALQNFDQVELEVLAELLDRLVADWPRSDL